MNKKNKPISNDRRVVYWIPYRNNHLKFGGKQLRILYHNSIVYHLQTRFKIRGYEMLQVEFLKKNCHKMIKWILIFFWVIQPSDVLACKCAIISLKKELSFSDQIFTGRVIKRTASDKVYYHFIVTEVFKGEPSDTITISSGFGGTDCGMEFLIGQEYLVYAKQKRTSRCQRNTLVLNNADIPKLRKLFGKRNKEKVIV